QACALSLQLKVRSDGAVDQDNVAPVPELDVAYVGEILEAAVGIEATVLNDERDIVNAVVRGKVKWVTRVIIDQKKSGQPAQYLLTGLFIQVRVVPAKRRILPDFE